MSYLPSKPGLLDRISTTVILVASLLLTPVLAAQEAQDAAKVREALATARDEGTPYHLRVDCTDKNGARNLEVFESGVAIWDDRAELRLDDDARVALLKILLRHEFSSLDVLYGGKKKAKEKATMAGAPMQIACRVTIEVAGVRKSSIQDNYGEQSPELFALATALLDHISPMVDEKSRTVDDLATGLQELAAGDLAPESFELRFVELPPKKGNRSTGAILHVARGVAKWRPYVPAQEFGTEETREVGGESFTELVRALHAAEPESLPVNLFSDNHLEIDVRILDQKKRLVARDFGRLSKDSLGEQQKRFDRLVEALETFRATVSEKK